MRRKFAVFFFSFTSHIECEVALVCVSCVDRIERIFDPVIGAILIYLGTILLFSLWMWKGIWFVNWPKNVSFFSSLDVTHMLHIVHLTNCCQVSASKVFLSNWMFLCYHRHHEYYMFTDTKNSKIPFACRIIRIN